MCIEGSLCVTHKTTVRLVRLIGDDVHRRRPKISLAPADTLSAAVTPPRPLWEDKRLDRHPNPHLPRQPAKVRDAAAYEGTRVWCAGCWCAQRTPAAVQLFCEPSCELPHSLPLRPHQRLTCGVVRTELLVLDAVALVWRHHTAAPATRAQLRRCGPVQRCGSTQCARSFMRILHADPPNAPDPACDSGWPEVRPNALVSRRRSAAVEQSGPRVSIEGAKGTAPRAAFQEGQVTQAGGRGGRAGPRRA